VCPGAEMKKAKTLPKDTKKVATAVFTRKVMAFKGAQEITLQLGYFCKKSCHPKLSKITQSGHTGLFLRPANTHLQRQI